MFLAVVSTASLAVGPADVSLWSVLGKLNAGLPISDLEKIVLLDIRLPRLCMGICVGAALALSGAVMQGLFRNPLADPGLVGLARGRVWERFAQSFWVWRCQSHYSNYWAITQCQARRFWEAEYRPYCFIRLRRAEGILR